MGAKFLKSDPTKQEDIARFERIKAKVISDMQQRNRSQEEITVRIKELESAFGILRRKAKQAELDEDAVITAYARIMQEMAAASIAGEIPKRIEQTLTERQRLLLIPTSNAQETAYQLERIKLLLEEHKPELLGHFGLEVEVGHVDRKVPNPRRGGKMEAKMTHPQAVKVMGEYLTSQGLTFDLIATNNGSGHGTEFDKQTLTPISQVGKISPFLTQELQDEAEAFGAAIAQHGTSGSDMDELTDIAETGVIKFNIATNYQQIILNVLSLIDDGLSPNQLLARCKADTDALVSGLHERTREKLKQMAQGFAQGTLTTEIEPTDTLFTRQIKLDYGWGIDKGKIKDDSSAQDIATVFAKEFKRVFCKMDEDLYCLGHSGASPIKRIGILTGGGPASGHNAIIYAAYIEARRRGAQLIGIFNGFDGLIKEKLVKKARPLTFEEVNRVKDYGGTIIGADRIDPYSKENIEKGIPQIIWRNIQRLQLDALITAGGDDTNTAGGNLSREHDNFPVIGLSKTMDNDLVLPDNAPTYGYHTWVSYATEQARRVEENARSVKRVMVIEAFGRNAGFAPLGVGMSIGAARTLIPEVEVDFQELVEDVRRYYERFGYAVVIVSEGIKVNPAHGKNQEMLNKAFAKDKIAEAYFTSVKKYDDFGHPKLEGAGRIVAAVLDAHLPFKVTEAEKITYASRAAPPTFSDFERCTLLGTGAVERIFSGSYGHLLYVDQGKIKSIPLKGELGGRQVDVEGDYRIQYMHANVAILLRDPDIFTHPGPESSNTYPLPVPEEFRKQTKPQHSQTKPLLKGKRYTIERIKGDRFRRGQKKTLENRLNELLVGISRRGPPELLEDLNEVLKTTQFIVTTRRSLLKDKKGRVCVASCNLGQKISKKYRANTVYIHPYYFSLPEAKQLEILYHELVSHIVKGLTDKGDKAMIDTQEFFIKQALQPKKGSGLSPVYHFKRNFERIKAFFEDKILPPHEIEIQPSASCNAACYFCWGKRLKLEGYLKDPQNMQTVINKILQAEVDGYRVERVKFIGSTGDPLMTPTTLKAIDSLRRAGRKASLFTNGIGLTYRTNGVTYAERLIHLSYLRISLDAGCDETLAKIKKLKAGSFAKIMRGLRILRNGADQNDSKLTIQVSFVISKDNYRDILSTARAAKENGAHAVLYKPNFIDENLTPEQKAHINQQLKQAGGLEDNKFKVILMSTEVTRCEECYYPYFWATVGADGQLYPCGHRALAGTEPFGNLLDPESSFMDIFRRQVKSVKERNFPDDKCEFCPPGDQLASDLMQVLRERSQQDGFTPALDNLYENYSSKSQRRIFGWLRYIKPIFSRFGLKGIFYLIREDFNIFLAFIKKYGKLEVRPKHLLLL